MKNEVKRCEADSMRQNEADKHDIWEIQFDIWDWGRVLEWQNTETISNVKFDYWKED